LLDGLGEDSGDGLGDDFFFFADAEALGDGVSDGVGVVALFFFGEGDFSGVAVGFGVGDFSSVVFFLLCLRGVGVGVGAKIFLSLVPIDCSARAGVAKFVNAAAHARTAIAIRAGRMESDISTSGRHLLATCAL
jgi:hypothetical protein